MLALHLSLCLLLLAVSSATKKPPTQPVNINTADSTQLQLVPGIGPSTAEKILQMRKSYGSFKSVNDLTAIRGIGPKRLEKMRKYLTVGKLASSNIAQPANCPGCPKTKLHAPTNTTLTKSAPAKSAATQKVPPPQPSSEQPAPETEEP
jgi:competence ComEA-like helix-hairpin-helix protein